MSAEATIILCYGRIYKITKFCGKYNRKNNKQDDDENFGINYNFYHKISCMPAW